MNKRLTLIVSILVVGLLFVFIYQSGFLSANDKVEFDPTAPRHLGSDWDRNINLAIEDLLKTDSIAQFMATVYPKDSTIDSLSWFRSASKAWDSLGHGLLYGYYLDKIATKTNTATDWYRAGKLLFNLQNLSNDSVAKEEIAKRATNALEKTIALDPTNLNAKAELGVCYMENPNMPPMKGVGLLREVLEIDPNHKSALYYLAYLFMKSGQYDKAIERLNKLIELDPKNPDYYRYKGQAQIEKGDKEGAKKSFSEYKELENDPNLQMQAQQIIDNLN